jgi:peptidoglycan-associated lipoprotein
VLALVVSACAKRVPPPAEPAPPPAATATTPPPAAPTPARPPAPPPQRVDESVPVAGVAADEIGGRTLDELNRNSPLKPVFFPLDSFELDADGRATASANADILRRYPTWMVTVEGHCDERGTAEYNLALGERRAVAVRTYLVSLGIAADRIRTVSYGKEFPFEPGHDEASWSKNRRAHFVITSK